MEASVATPRLAATCAAFRPCFDSAVLNFFFIATNASGCQRENQHGDERKDGSAPSWCAQVEACSDDCARDCRIAGCGARYPDNQAEDDAERGHLKEDGIMKCEVLQGLEEYPDTGDRHYNQEKQLRLPAQRRG
jgi:hypothetical protein